jgi:hypothetical protein
MESFNPNRLSHVELREFAAQTEGTDRRSVIVELDAPPADVDATPLEFSRPRPPRRDELCHAGRKPDEALETAADMNRLGRSLEKLELDKPPVRLDYAQAYILSVTPDQLRSITHMPGVGLVRPNRTHHVPPR